MDMTPERRSIRNTSLAKKKRLERKALGICIKCGKNKARPGKTDCQSCFEKYRAKRIAHSHLPETKERNRKRMAARRARLIKGGLCATCGKKTPVSGVNDCQECLDKRKAAYWEHRSAYDIRKTSNLCTRCGVSLDSYPQIGKQHRALCDECRAIRRRTRNQKANPFHAILERDGWQCAVCGRDKSLIIHHKDGRGSTLPPEQRNDDPSNLITLCRYCHYGITCLRTATADGRLLAAALITY